MLTGTSCWQMIRDDVFLMPTQNQWPNLAYFGHRFRVHNCVLLSVQSAKGPVRLYETDKECNYMQQEYDNMTHRITEKVCYSRHRFLSISFSQLCRVDMQLYDSRPH